ncbi:MAG: methionyl-tRNA formyltransferase [Gammaproteobacteria bacterium]|nr:methionyl-tRNA formyltransferase [Gammaproteobacteria bacterium]
MTSALAVAFAGTPAFALPALEAIAASRHRLVAVYTQPDRPAGRGRHLTASPVAQRATTLGLPVEKPLTLRDPQVQAGLASQAPDVLVVVAYGLLLPRAVLATPRLGCINIHASLLPRWRGAAPVQRAIEAGDAATGVSIMRMEEGLDTGPVLLAEATPIGARETAGELLDRLADVGARLILPALDALAAGTATFAAQDPARVTLAPRVGKAEARIDWRWPAVLIERRVRAFNPWPVAEAIYAGAQLRIQAARVVDAPPGPTPGTVLDAGADGIVVMTGAAALAIERLQAAGGRPMAAAEFARSRALVGQVLGAA